MTVLPGTSRPHNETALSSVTGALVKRAGAEIVRRRQVVEHVVGNHENAVSTGECRTFLALACQPLAFAAANDSQTLPRLQARFQPSAALATPT